MEFGRGRGNEWAGEYKQAESRRASIDRMDHTMRHPRSGRHPKRGRKEGRNRREGRGGPARACGTKHRWREGRWAHTIKCLGLYIMDILYRSIVPIRNRLCVVGLYASRGRRKHTPCRLMHMYCIKRWVLGSIRIQRICASIHKHLSRYPSHKATVGPCHRPPPCPIQPHEIHNQSFKLRNQCCVYVFQDASV